jgi:acyl-CoA synthetase (AMP-forming)/AMP-acid ligase II
MGKADIVRSETIKALVKLKPGKEVTEQEIRQYCQGRMADYKLPKEIDIVDTLPAKTPLWRRLPNLEPADIKLE